MRNAEWVRELKSAEDTIMGTGAYNHRRRSRRAELKKSCLSYQTAWLGWVGKELGNIIIMWVGFLGNEIK